MADEGLHVIEVRAGSSARTHVELALGAPVQPTSIGRAGQWAIEAPEILDVHAYFYFDGHSLFVQSANTASPAKGNGRPIGNAWQQVEIPCTLELGRARLVYRALEELDLEDEEADKTVARMMEAPAAARAPMPIAPPPPNPAGLGEPEPTIVAPIKVDDSLRNAQPKPRPAAGLPAAPPPPAQVEDELLAPTAIGAPQAPPPPPAGMGYQSHGSIQVAEGATRPPPAHPYAQGAGMSPMAAHPGAPFGMQPMMGMGQTPMGGATVQSGRAASGETFLERCKRDWRETSIPKKVMLALMPLLFAAVVATQRQKEERERQAEMDEQRARAAASASASASTKPATPDVAPTQTALATTPTLTLTPSASAAPTAVVPPVSTAKTPAPKGSNAPKSLERLAVDAVASNNFEQAASLYDQLAAQTLPQDPRHQTYSEAARILRVRAGHP